MELQEACNTFAIRLYEWAVRDLSRELIEGCPLLAEIGRFNPSVAALVSWNLELTRENRRFLAEALTLLYHENARNLCKKEITNKISQWGEAYYEETSARMRIASPQPFKTDDYPVRPQVVLEALGSALSPCLGGSSTRENALLCTKRVADWKIVTDFGFASKERKLSFEYQFIRIDGHAVTEAGHGPFPRNLLAFYGIYPHTVVEVPSRDYIEATARLLIRAAEHFVSEAETLFAGLGVSD